MIAVNDSFLVGTVFSCLELHCGSPMVVMYYRATKINVQKDLCAYCVKVRATVDQEL